MENHLKTMQDEIEAMEKQFTAPVEDTTPVDKAQVDLVDTLDSMVEDVETEEEVEVEEFQKKPKRTNWKSRYTKYRQSTDATIFELRKDNANYISQVQLLSKRIDEMNKSTADADTTSFADKFSDVDKEIFGEDALSSLEEATNAAVEPLKKQLADEKAWREQQLELQRSKSKQSASTFFLNALAKAVPDYAEIDLDPSFGKYMSQPDTISGIQRVQLFKQAEQNGDAARVATFMNEFKEANAPIDNLKNKVSPVSTSTASPASNQGDKMSMVDINKYYDDVMKGKYRNNEKSRMEMEHKVNTALGNGDVY